MQAPEPQPSRPVSADPASRSTPYSYVHPAHSTEDLSARFNAWQPLSSDGTKQDPSRLSPNANMGRTRNIPELAPLPKIDPALEKDAADYPNDYIWSCDGRRPHPIANSSARMHCLDCDDYDLCGPCYEAGECSKDHKADHKAQHIIKSYSFKQSSQDLIPPGDGVHPQTRAGKTQPNWSIEGEFRWHHLLGESNHARYLGPTIEPDHYQATFYIQFQFSKSLTQAHYDQLREGGFGSLHLAAGIIKSKQTFFRERFAEDESLMSNLFSCGVYETYKMDSGAVGKFTIPVDFHVEPATGGQNNVLGLVLQWLDVQSFVGSDEPLVNISLDELRYVPGVLTSDFPE